jgi:hypothetical protein
MYLHVDEVATYERRGESRTSVATSARSAQQPFSGTGPAAVPAEQQAAGGTP